MFVAAGKITQRAFLERAGVRAPAWRLPLWRSFGRGAQVLDFGKHKGLTFAQCLEQDIAYCQWFVANGVTHGKLGMIQFLSFLEARRPKTVWQETMTYGKHKGMSYEDMFMNDLPYCEWVRQRDPLFAAKTDRMILAAKIAQRVSGRQAGTTAATRWQPISRSFASSSEVVDFGKHRGLTFEEILQKERDYCEWAVSIEAKDQTTASMAKLITFLKAAGVEPKKSTPETVSGGKHSGKSYEEVFTDDPAYCEWVLKNSKDNMPSGSFADWIRARHPQFAAKVGRS